MIKSTGFCFALGALLLFLPATVRAQAILEIAEARLLPLGSTVTVRGIALNGTELGTIRYLQDGSAGIAAFPGTGSQPGFSAAVKAGDSIEVTGVLFDFNGLLEISPILSYAVLAGNRPLPAPKGLSSLADLGGGAYQSQRVSIGCLRFPDAPRRFAAGTAYDVVDPSGSRAAFFVRNNHPWVGSPIPSGPVRVTAIASYANQPQLISGLGDDYLPEGCLHVADMPVLEAQTTNTLTFRWRSSAPTRSWLLYGRDSVMQGRVDLPGIGVDKMVDLTGLDPATVYWVQTVDVSGSDTVRTPFRPYITVSASTGRIKVLFNKGYDEFYAAPYAADGSTFEECLQEVLNRIDSACCTIDVSVYNNNRSDIVSRLSAAHSRGVRVRYVAAEDASNTALSPPPPFPVVFGNSRALMHNKFMVCDVDFPDRAWVLTGSMNWTTNNLRDDPNNTLCVQDQSLARTYTLEMDEMWGSTGPVPNLALARFGAAKRDNTPHEHLIGGRRVESWFSPSDRTTLRIQDALAAADQQLSFALLTVTRDDLGLEMLDAWNRTGQVRGMIQNTGDQSSEFPMLVAAGVPVVKHSAGHILHHKYAVVDPGDPQSDPLVVTGSHNWSNAAEQSNDENTLIIRDYAISRLFQAEFERRWALNTVSVQVVNRPEFVVFPNPFCSDIQLNKPEEAVRFWLLDPMGRVRAEGALNPLQSIIRLPDLESGPYFLKLIGQYGATTIPVQKICR